MTFGAEPAGPDPLAHTVHIWPSRELIARSWEWSQSWHAAYEQAASDVGRAVGVCVLGGLPVVEHPIALELPFGCVTFSVSVWGTSIYISITEFDGPDGPDSPGPGGCHQPRSADGLGLGLRGMGKDCQIVTFYGYLPPLPAAYQAPSGALCKALTGVSGEEFAFGGIRSTIWKNDIDLRWNISTNSQTFGAGRLNDAGPAVLCVQVSEDARSGRTAPVPASDIPLTTPVAFARKAPSPSRTRSKARHGYLVGVDRFSWMNMSDGKDIMLLPAKWPIVCDYQIKPSSFDRPSSQCLH